MTTAGAVAATSPPPPPPLLSEQRGMVVNGRGRPLFVAWDHVAVLGPISRADLYARIGASLQAGGAWREYMRHHRHIRDADAGRMLQAAERWHFDREIATGIANGFLVEANGFLVVGDCPPAHQPLDSMGGTEGAVRIVLAEHGRTALDVLRSKEAWARQKPTRAGRARLKSSLQTVGQLYPIRRYRAGGGWVVVDGVTREELLHELGIEPQYVEVEGSAVKALMERIHHETCRTTKDESKIGDYLAALAEQGIKPDEIVAALTSATGGVEALVKRLPKSAARKPPPDVEVDEWVQLAEAGWTPRDIAEATGWPQNIVERWLSRRNGNGDGRRNKAPTALQIAILKVFARHPQGIGINRAFGESGMGEKRSGKVVPSLTAKGYIEPAGKVGKEHLYRLTAEGRELVERLADD